MRNDNPQRFTSIANTGAITSPDLQLAFDVGHSSIGWAVLQSPKQATAQAGDPSVNILGCGVVTFRADDCLASTRRGYRRQRRHIRSTRQRIARIKILLAHLGVLKKDELDLPGCAWPWLLAARVLRGGQLLAWPELWDVLRWYAHNRGYDGNRRWSAAEAEAAAEDTEKEENARTLMSKFGVKTMAESFCAISGLDPLGSKKSCHLPGDKRPKGQNAAFPRAIVENEVRRILQAHFGKLAKVDKQLERALLGLNNQDAKAWQAIPCPDLKLPKRYQGALLFGQLVPRFDNRIISKCPISDEKVPSRNCSEFLNFRWAMQLANIRIARFGERELSALKVSERKELDTLMRQQGGMGVEEFKKQVRQVTSAIRDNLDTMFMHPDAKESLLLDPVQKLIQSTDLKSFWPLLPEPIQKRTRGQWRRGKILTLAIWREQLGSDTAAFDAEVTRHLDAVNIKGRKKDKPISREELLAKSFFVKKLDQRAAFSRSLLKKAFDEVMIGRHPKEENGCLFLDDKIREAQLNRGIDEQTNNHLVRHRLLILERLLSDIVKEYAASQPKHVGKITIEVNRDLREMSGKTAKEKAQDLGLRIANHHAVAEKLEKAFEEENLRQPITAGLIRKARIAEDLGWTCPYTSHKYEPKHLITHYVDKDHIVPRSDRASDSLESLAVTFSAINKWKGKRTAYQFVEQEQGKTVPDLPNLSIMSLARYKSFVEGLEAYKGHDNDKRRKKKRKELLLLPKYEEKEFVPRDLTQTSQLVRLGAQVLRKNLPHLTTGDVISLPGSVTGTVRKAWKVLGCLSLANSSVLNEEHAVKTKTEIRDITHLHHALDACVLGLVSHFIPNNGRVWELIVKRNPNDAEKKELMALGVFGFSPENRFEMRDLDSRLKDQIRQRLAEKRVVQHIPARMDGLRVEQNMWRVVKIEDDKVILRQRIRQADHSRPEKITEEKQGKLLGLNPAKGTGKLAINKGVLVIPDNYGVSLDPEPAIIPYHKVWPRLQEFKKMNQGKIPRIIRNGQIIRVSGGKNFKGVWKVFSAKNNAAGMALDIGSPDVVRLKNKTVGHKINVRLATLIADGLEIIKTPLTGVAVCPTTSSA
jgi:hypothetical protein